MILHTVMPPELIFAGAPASEAPVELEMAGRRLLVERQGPQWVITRLLSSDPADFLDPRWQPGTVIPPSPV